MRLVRLVCLIVLACTACAFPRPEDIGDDLAVDFTLTLTSSRVRIVEGTSATVDITLGRNDFTDPVNVTVAGLPTGVTADPLTIVADSGALTLHAAPDATQGDAKLTITAAGGPRSHDAPLSLLAMGPAGTVDRSFSSGGVLSMPPSDRSHAITIQPDGKIVIVGYVGRATQDILVGRYLPDGTPDPSFSGGLVMFDATTLHDQGQAVALQPDGKIVVAGTFSIGGGGSDGLVVRFNADGSPDLDFGTGGSLQLLLNPPGTSKFTELNALALQPDGGIVVAGRTRRATQSGTDAVVARIAPTGQLDNSFGVSGRATAPFGPGTNRFLSLALQSDGRIVAAGSALESLLDNIPPVAAFARFTTAGRLDNSFSGDGMVMIGVVEDTEMTTARGAVAVAIQPDGKILAAGGGSANNRGSGVCLIRLNGNDGSLDASLGTKGVAVVHLSSNTRSPSLTQALSLQPDGKFLIGGLLGNGILDQDGFERLEFVVARFGSDAVLDFGFAGGIVRHDFSLGIDGASNDFKSIALDAEGRILVTGGYYFNGVVTGRSKVILARIWP